MAEIQKLPVMFIQPSPMNPRKTFDEAKIEELAQNIEEQGLLQPITVRKINDEETHIDEETGEVVSVGPRYEIICGERRFRAWNMLANKSARYNEIPCIVREMTDEQAFDAMITENLQRQDVDPVEEAIAFSLLLENGNAVEDIAVRFGKSIRFVQDRVKLKGLISELIEMLRKELLPISGAMLLAKLDKELQKEFFDSRVKDEDVTLYEVKDYLDDLFCVIDKAQFFDEDKFTDEISACSGCVNNTANHGCLFYEMKGKEQKCINRECFTQKQQEYVKYRVMKEAENLVKKGEPLTFDKSVILVEAPHSWDNDKEKQRKADAIRMYNDMGFEVVHENVFDQKCWYNENDERIAEKLSNNEVFRCIEVLGYNRPEFKVSYYYLKKSSKADCPASKQVEAENIRQQMKRNKELVIEKATETMRKWADEITDYSNKADEMTLNEQVIFDVLVIKSCGYKFLSSLGMNSDNIDIVKYVTEHQQDRMKWYREFIRYKLSEASVTYSKQLQECQNMLFREQYPAKYKEMSDKLNDAYQKKDERLKAKLKELENEQQ